MRSTCPHCGKVTELSPEYFKRRWLCDCGQEYTVGIVNVRSDMFLNGTTQIACPYCGERNVLPLNAANKDVSCGICGEKFHVHFIQLHTQPYPLSKQYPFPSTGSSAKKIWIIISLIGFIILLIWSAPSFLELFRQATGTDLGLGNIIYDDSDCCLEVSAALSEKDYNKAMKWAKRIKDERIRRITISNIESEKVYDKKIKKALREMPYSF